MQNPQSDLRVLYCSLCMTVLHFPDRRRYYSIRKSAKKSTVCAKRRAWMFCTMTS